MWKANIDQIVNDPGRLSVHLVFFDEATNRHFKEEMVTTQPQDDEWVQERVTKRIAELVELDSFSQKLMAGEIAPKEKIEKVLSPKDEYAEDLKTYQRFLTAQRQGFTTEEDATFKQLQTKLRTNFSPDFIDLF